MTGFSSRVFHPPLPGDGRRRDIFPLPCLQCPETIRGGMSRSVQRRIQRKIAETKQVNRALLALNSLYFGGNKILPTASIEELSSLPLCQQDVIKSVIKRVRELGCPPVDACCSGALSALRVPSGSYSDMDPGVGDVVPMRLDQLSLPTGNVAGVNINEHLSGSSSEVVNEFETYMLHDASVWGDLQEYAPSLKPYDDPSLRSHKQYLKFLSHLHQCGVLGFTDQCKGRVGAFTVSKKPKFEGSKRIDRQRLVLDCRQTNLLFKQPPLTELGSLSALLELGPEEELFASGSDIRDCFYACYCPQGMEKYFCLVKDISPEDAAYVTGRPRDVFEDMARVSPCIVVLPMGFSWSFYLVQALHENISLEALGKPRSDLILDGWPAPKLSESGVALMPYCDNVHCIGLDASLVQNSKDKVCAGLTNAGFELHEDVDATTFFPTLGGTLDGKLGQVRASNKRVWNLIYAFEFISMHIVTPRMVQQLLGHAMVVCVLNRSGMSVFRSLYDFVQQNGAPRRLNNKEIWECEVFIGILPLLFSDLRRE